MKYSKRNNSYFKVFPLKSIPVSQEVGMKLERYKIRESESKLIDYRTPFYAVKSTDAKDVVRSSRISGVEGVRPISRPEIVEKALAIVMPHIQHNKDYVAWEEKFFAYRFSSRSIRASYDMIAEKTVYPYFINAQTPLSVAALKAIEQALPI